jgi:DNA invertase Pin-like site-specific DNA recombinase
MKPAAIYARVSTDRCDVCSRSEASHKAGRFKGEAHAFVGQDPERQLRELRQYCVQRGWEYVEYVDRITGMSEDRPQFLVMKEKIRRGAYRALVVLDYDRFARSTVHLINALDELGALNVGFVSVNQSVDTTRPEGRLMFTILAGFAEFERAIMRRRIMSGLENAKAKGKSLGRPRINVNLDRIRKLKNEDHKSIRQICAIMGLGKGTVERALKGADQ